MLSVLTTRLIVRDKTYFDTFLDLESVLTTVDHAHGEVSEEFM